MWARTERLKTAAASAAERRPRRTPGGTGRHRARQRRHVPIQWSLALACLAWTVLCLEECRAGDGPWRLDEGGSRIGFEVSVLGMIGLQGTFERFSGRVDRVGENALDLHAVEFTVEAGSLSMRQPRQEAWARSPEFFSVDRHPYIRFRSDPFPGDLALRGGSLDGRLELRGHERPVRFQIVSEACMPEGSACHIDVEGRVRRSEFGMRSRRIAVGDQVRLYMQLRIVRGDAAEAQPVGAEADRRR